MQQRLALVKRDNATVAADLQGKAAQFEEVKGKPVPMGEESNPHPHPHPGPDPHPHPDPHPTPTPNQVAPQMHVAAHAEAAAAGAAWAADVPGLPVSRRLAGPHQHMGDPPDDLGRLRLVRSPRA